MQVELGNISYILILLKVRFIQIFGLYRVRFMQVFGLSRVSL